RLDLRLARRDLALTGLQDLAHDHVLYLLGFDVGALQRRRDRSCSEFSGIEGAQPAAHLPDGGARGAENHGLGHDKDSTELGSGVPCPSTQRPPLHSRPTPTRSRSASSTARTSATTPTTARCRRCWTPARPSASSSTSP